MKKIFIYVGLLLNLVFYSTFAQVEGTTNKVGTTAATFLKIGAGARAIGMGGAYTALSDDIYSVYYNPAGIARTEGMGQVTFNHAEWLADMDFDFAAGSFNMGDLGTLFASFTSFRVPEDKVRTFDHPEGDGRYWDATSLAIGIGYAKMLTDRFSIGFHAKYIRESIWNCSASGFALDIGTYYVTPFNDLVIGATITNFGTKMQLDGRDIQFNIDPNDDFNSGPNNIPAQYEMGKYDMPMRFRLGLSMNVVKTRYFRATTSVDAVVPNDNSEYLNTGLELTYDELIFARIGYKELFMVNAEGGLTFGAGVKYKINDNFKVFVNYGYSDYNRLKNVQFIDVGIIF